MFAAGGFGLRRTLALYSSTTFNVGPITHSYTAPMLYSSRGSASMLKTHPPSGRGNASSYSYSAPPALGLPRFKRVRFFLKARAK
jgi:hypothetical protein